MAVSATQTLKEPAAGVALAFGVAITRNVYCPTAACNDRIAVVAPVASVVIETSEAPWVTATLAVLSAAGVCKSVNVTVRSVDPAILNVSWVGAGASLAATSTVSGARGVSARAQ